MGVDDQLTIVVPTRNRPRHLGALLKFLRENGVTSRILVADSSDTTAAGQVAEVCKGSAEIRSFAPALAVIEKIVAALELVETRYVVMLPDDDVTFPHAIRASLAHLVAHPDFVAAQGYVLDLGIEGETFDLARVRWFTPSITEDGPIARTYHLVRRYQPSIWAVFRRDALIAAMTAGRAMSVILFQEMTVMIATALQGKIARVPHVYCLRGMEESLSSLSGTHPFYAFLTDSEGFFTNYRAYRDNLVRVVHELCPATDLVQELQLYSVAEAAPGTGAKTRVTLEHALNLIHALAFPPVLDAGMVNYTIQRMFGVANPPIPVEPQWHGSHAIGAGDVQHSGRSAGRRYVWRREALEAQPRNEIHIDANEIMWVEEQLERYAIG